MQVSSISGPWPLKYKCLPFLEFAGELLHQLDLLHNLVVHLLQIEIVVSNYVWLRHFCFASLGLHIENLDLVHSKVVWVLRTDALSYHRALILVV